MKIKFNINEIDIAGEVTKCDFRGCTFLYVDEVNFDKLYDVLKGDLLFQYRRPSAEFDGFYSVDVGIDTKKKLICMAHELYSNNNEMLIEYEYKIEE